MKRLLLLFVSVALFAACGGEKPEDKEEETPETPSYSLKTDKTEYKVGETITVDFVANAEWDDNAWVGLIPSSVAHGTEAENDANDIAYKYLKKKESGTLEFVAKKAGEFDLRMNESDAKADAKEVASVSFVVVGDENSGEYSLKTDKTEYKVGETITVEFVANAEWDNNAWVGLIPSATAHGTEAENDKHDIAYKYLKKQASGTLEFVAKEAGDFDLRMNESDAKADAKEVASVSFVVKG